MTDGAIGIFDSGVGGLTVVQRVCEILPHEPLIYLGDTARYPYGTKSREVVTQYALESAAFLSERGVKALVVACNTVSAVSLSVLRDRYTVPVIGVIEPGARSAAALTRSRRLGVIGTEATISSGAYTQALRRIDPNVEIYTRACPLFVPLAEEGWIDNAVARSVADLYLASFRTSGIDVLILGCTHYPLLRGTIQACVGERVRIVDSAEATAREVKNVLTDHGLLRGQGSGSTSFFVTDAPDRFIRIGQRFLGERVDSAVRIE